MLENKDIVCLSTIDWDFLRQRHQVFMKFLSQNNCRVFYIENFNPPLKPNFSIFPKSIKRIKKILFKGKMIRSGVPANITIVTPLILPFRNKLAGFINKRLLARWLCFWLKLKGLKSPVAWTYLATPLAVEFIKKLNPQLLVYDCVFDIKTHPDYAKDIAASEERLIRLSDLVLTDNHFLFKRCYAINSSTHLIPPGVDFELFSSADKLRDGGLLMAIGNPKICFFGGIDQIRLDLKLLAYIAKARPHWQIILLGPVIKTDVTVLKLENIHFLGTLKHETLAQYLKEMAVLILPYKIIPFSKSIMPAKIFECLATGKPIVSAPLEELRMLPEGLINFASTKEEFVTRIEESLESDSQEKQNLRLRFAENNSWRKRLEELRIILDRLQNKRGER